MRERPWEHGIDDWPGVTGGFVGRSQRPAGGRLIACEKYASALAEMGMPNGPIVEAQQVHGARLAMVVPAMLGEDRPQAACIEGVDALLTEVPGVALAIYVADCLAILMHHRERPGIGIAHAGWRGLEADIPGVMVRAALDAWGGAPGDMSFALSPCIEVCCFEVGEEVAAVFEEIPGAVDRSRRHPHVDLRRVARARLGSAGVASEQVFDLPGCTRCDPRRFASYRWDPERCGRNIALLALRG